MARALKTLVTLTEGADPKAVTAALAGDEFELVDTAAGADLAVVGCDGDADRAVELVAAAAAGGADRPVVALLSEPPNGLMERLFAAGADDIVVLPEDRERVAFAIRKAVARRTAPAAARAGRVVTVLGPKGGSGKTTVSANLAVALAAAGTRTTAVDVDLQFGDLALTLGLEPKRTLYDLARSGGGIDAEKIDGFALHHRSGARALLAPRRPDEAGAVGVDLLNELWRTLRAAGELVVVDTAAGFPPETIAAIDASADLVLVGMLDAGSLKDTRLGLETLALMGRGAEDVVVVLNRADSRVGLDLRDVEEILGRAPDVLVPSDRAVPRSVNEGRPIVESSPRSGPGRAFAELAALLRRRAEVSRRAA